MYSKSAQYGMRAIIYMAVHAEENKNIGLLEIARDQKIPSHFLSKILQQLVKGKVLVSVKGPNGGFQVKKNLSNVTLRRIVDIIDGKDKHLKCMLGYKHCSNERPCPVHSRNKPVQKNMDTLLDKSLNYYRLKVEDDGCAIKDVRKRK